MTSGASTGSTTHVSCVAARSPAITPNTGARSVDAVVEHGERQLELVVGLSDRDDLVAGVAQDPPRALGERLAAKRRERLRRAEPLGRAADEQHAGRSYTIRHGSE